MRIATYSINGVNGRLPVLLRWLEQGVGMWPVCRNCAPPEDRFPAGPVRDAGYNAICTGRRVGTASRYQRKYRAPTRRGQGSSRLGKKQRSRAGMDRPGEFPQPSFKKRTSEAAGLKPLDPRGMSEDFFLLQRTLQLFTEAAPSPPVQSYRDDLNCQHVVAIALALCEPFTLRWRPRKCRVPESPQEPFADGRERSG